MAGYSHQCSQRGTSHFDFERASVLWNTAALYSYQAAKEDWKSKEGRINAKTHYTLAAKIILHIKDMLKSEKDPDLVPDMYTSCLTMCHEMLYFHRTLLISLFFPYYYYYYYHHHHHHHHD